MSKIFSQKNKYAWSKEVQGPITSQTQVSDTHIIFGTQSGQLICMDLNGTISWQYNTSPDMSNVESIFVNQEEISSILCQPAIINNNIYVGTESGELHCITPDGTLVWKEQTDGAIRAMPTIYEKDSTTYVVVGTTKGSIYFFDTKGTTHKIIKIHTPITTQIKIIKDFLFMGCQDGKVVACNTKGLHLWTYETKGPITANIMSCELFSDGEITLLVSSQDNNLYNLSLDGELQWKFSTKGALTSSAVVVHLSSNESKDVLIGSCDNSIYCLNAHGEKLWSYETDFWITSSPVLVKKNGLYKIGVGSYDQKFYVFDGESDFQLSYMPGLAGIINQTGYSSLATSRDAGQSTAKKLFEQEVQGHIISCASVPHSSKVIVTTKQGFMYEFSL